MVVEYDPVFGMFQVFMESSLSLLRVKLLLSGGLSKRPLSKVRKLWMLRSETLTTCSGKKYQLFQFKAILSSFST